MFRPKFAALGAAMLSLVLFPSAAGAAHPESTIENVNVACVSGSFAVTVTFTRGGPPLQVRVYEYEGTEVAGAESLWFRGGSKDNTYVTHFEGGTNRTFTVHLQRTDQRSHTMVDIAPPQTVGPFSCAP
jgi:hypothetical protein